MELGDLEEVQHNLCPFFKNLPVPSTQTTGLFKSHALTTKLTGWSTPSFLLLYSVQEAGKASNLCTEGLTTSSSFAAPRAEPKASQDTSRPGKPPSPDEGQELGVGRGSTDRASSPPYLRASPKRRPRRSKQRCIRHLFPSYLSDTRDSC